MVGVPVAMTVYNDSVIIAYDNGDIWQGTPDFMGTWGWRKIN